MKRLILAGMTVVALTLSSCSAKTADSSATETDTDAIATAENPEQLPEVTVAVDTAGYTTTSTGLKYKEIKPGKPGGKKPSGPASVVRVHYTGKHLNGETFDSSVDRGEPIDFPLNRVIPGWTEGVQLMSEGAKYQFLIPSVLAYGPAGQPPVIGPDEDLYFEVELLEVEPTTPVQSGQPAQ